MELCGAARNVLRRKAFLMMMYADDTQLYVSFKAENSDATRAKLKGSIADIKEWMVLNHLKLNESKTEYFVRKSARSRKNFDSVATINIGSSTVSAVGEANNIGVLIDAIRLRE